MKFTNDPLLLQRALRMAAEMISEHSQLYDEVSTPDQWMAELIERVKREMAGADERSAGLYQVA